MNKVLENELDVILTNWICNYDKILGSDATTEDRKQSRIELLHNLFIKAGEYQAYLFASASSFLNQLPEGDHLIRES